MYRKKVIWVLAAVLLLIWWKALPDPLFDPGYSTVLFDRNQRLLGARIADDGQWRFPELRQVPEKFAKAIITFEDQRFRYHPGIDPIAIVRAMVQNIRAGKTVSGASTLTMQTIRLSRDGKPRSILEKTIEAMLAIVLEIRCTKEEILVYYASHAPFGGNVVGLEAAAWRYFGKSPHHLSWAETATLAVLPNAPALIHPGRNRTALVLKRNRLLNRLMEEGIISDLEYQSGMLEPIPDSPLPLPQWSPHLVMKKLYEEKVIVTEIDLDLQQRAADILNFHHQINRQKGIHNAAILVLDNHSGKPLVYLGNTPGDDAENAVDMIHARRSSGSILKPFLYAAMLEAGKIAPDQLLRDVPVNIDGFNPKNYNKHYHGGVKASEAIARSLNVPAVNMLQEYGVEKFRGDLIEAGFSSITYDAGHYGLSLILGGAEVTLWDLCRAYRNMALALINYPEHSSSDGYNPGVVHSVFMAMQSVIRPGDDGHWEAFSSSLPVAWKTGTSYGHRDAWAVGITPKYTIGVWVGNADGEGRPEIIGSKRAGSILFDILYQLPGTGDWFSIPHDHLMELPVCRLSGYLAGKACGMDTDTMLVPETTVWAPPCPYHFRIFVNPESGNQADRSCHPDPQEKSWFHLPADMAHYYRKTHADYRELPPFDPKCRTRSDISGMALLYPSAHHTMVTTQGLGGKRQAIVLKASHDSPDARIHWHLNGKFLGTTSEFHEMKIFPDPGLHKIRLLDDQGNAIDRTFEVAGKASFTAL